MYIHIGTCGGRPNTRGSMMEKRSEQRRVRYRSQLIRGVLTICTYELVPKVLRRYCAHSGRPHARTCPLGPRPAWHPLPPGPETAWPQSQAPPRLCTQARRPHIGYFVSAAYPTLCHPPSAVRLLRSPSLARVIACFIPTLSLSLPFPPPFFSSRHPSHSLEPFVNSINFLDRPSTAPDDALLGISRRDSSPAITSPAKYSLHAIDPWAPRSHSLGRA